VFGGVIVTVLVAVPGLAESTRTTFDRSLTVTPAGVGLTLVLK
jgi:hypothetical protein